MYGWIGTVLRVDLSNQNITKEPLNKNSAEKFIGGRGLNGITLYREVGPEIDPISPENRLIFGVGPCNGTISVGSGRCTVTGKSPLSGVFGDSNFGGNWAPELKYAGYDQLIIQGKSDTPVYLWIDDDEVEIRPAGHIWGKTITETDKLLRDEIGDPSIQITYIGPGSEKLIKFGNIMSNLYRAAGRTGMGCIMGSKNLKAVAVRGSKGVKVADPQSLMDVVQKAYGILREDKVAQLWKDQGTMCLTDKYNLLGTMSGRNFQDPVVDVSKYTGEVFDEKYKVKNRACMGCPLHCGGFNEITDGPRAGYKWGKIEYGSADNFLSRLGLDDLEFSMEACKYADEHTVDAIQLGGSMSFAFECYEKGILTENDTDGLRLEWGNKEAVWKLMENIVNKRGLGEILAEGSRKASEIIGKGSEEFALHTKGLDHVEADPRGLMAWGLAYAVSSRGADHLRALPAFEMSITPERAKELFGTEEAGDRFATKGKGKMVKWYEELRAFEDSMETCKFICRTELNSPGPLAEILNAVTGLGISENDVMLIGERIVNVERAFNVREGIRRKDDSLPRRFLEEPLPFGPAAGHVHKLEPMLDDYYKLRGWDKKTGIPLDKKFEELGLQEMIPDLQSIRKKDSNTPSD
ncbi:MAG: aldehyde ferredoxin oxidoreductase family protein [Deltaproteobacteria bacterium]|nr:aldehyde ferredoxin oxidoreductase family protein [Deltaproteobacteria bacterium]